MLHSFRNSSYSYYVQPSRLLGQHCCEDVSVKRVEMHGKDCAVNCKNDFCATMDPDILLLIKRLHR